MYTNINATGNLDSEVAIRQSRRHVFHPNNIDDYEQILHQGIKLIKQQMLTVEKPFTGVTPKSLASQFASIDLSRPLGSIDAVLNELKELYLKDAVYFHLPSYMAHLNCPVSIPALLAEQLLTAINSSVDTWDQSAGATLIEQKLIDWTRELIGFDDQGDGIFTSGGTQSNLMALLLARNNYALKQAGIDIKLHGLPADASDYCILSSDVSHFSLQKSAAILGLGYQSVITVASNDKFEMDPEALKSTLTRCALEGKKVIAIVATAGTTDFGSIDHLNAIADIARDHGVWFHVDAAYGCGLLVSPSLKHRLYGIEQADSVTVDYHKSFLQPVSCGAFLVKDSSTLACITHHADYLNPLSQVQEGVPNLVNKSIQTTRRFDALKLWLTMRIMGSEQVGTIFDYVIQLAQDAHKLMEAKDAIEVLHRPTLSTLVFRYCPRVSVNEELLNTINQNIRKTLMAEGAFLIAGTRYRGIQYLKVTLLNPFTQVGDLAAVLDKITSAGDNLLTEHVDRFAIEKKVV